MRRKAPDWWFAAPGDGFPWQPAGLMPAAWLYGAVARARWRLVQPYRCRLPVLCVGNLTVGGAGKTPMALVLADMVEHLGLAPVFLSRGYGGRMVGPHLVQDGDQARDVGDEPLLLAARSPTVVARDRRAGARFIERRYGKADARPAAVIMDDGFQNPQLFKDLSIIVLDGATGIGNGRVLPAGPLRAPLDFQLARADALVINGRAGAGALRIARRMQAQGKPVCRVQVVASQEAQAWRGREVIAYAGIARPGKFFDLLDGLGVNTRMRLPYGDHHAYSDADARFLLELSAVKGLPLVTTEKDLVRLPKDGPGGALRAASTAIPIALHIEDGTGLRALLHEVLRREGA